MVRLVLQGLLGCTVSRRKAMGTIHISTGPPGSRVWAPQDVLIAFAELGKTSTVCERQHDVRGRRLFGCCGN